MCKVRSVLTDFLVSKAYLYVGHWQNVLCICTFKCVLPSEILTFIFQFKIWTDLTSRNYSYNYKVKILNEICRIIFYFIELKSRKDRILVDFCS